MYESVFILPGPYKAQKHDTAAVTRRPTSGARTQRIGSKAFQNLKDQFMCVKLKCAWRTTVASVCEMLKADQKKSSIPFGTH